MLYLIIFISVLKLVNSQTCNYDLAHFQQDTYIDLQCTFNEELDLWKYDDSFCDAISGSKLFSLDPITDPKIQFQQNALALEANMKFIQKISNPDVFFLLNNFMLDNKVIIEQNCEDVSTCNSAACLNACGLATQVSDIVCDIEVNRVDVLRELNSPDFYLFLTDFASLPCVDSCCESCTLNGQTTGSSGQLTEDVNMLIGIGAAALAFSICACLIVCMGCCWWGYSKGYNPFSEEEEGY